jgi:hypothetical protein
MPQFSNASSSVASGAVKTFLLDTRRVRKLTVIWRLLGTGTVGDLSLNDVMPVLQDGTVVAAGLPATATVAPVVAGSDVVAMKQYDVSGLERVSVTAKNNNAGALNMAVEIAQEITL